MGDRAGEGRGYGNLGIAHRSQGAYAKAIKYHTKDLAIAKELGDRAGEGRAYANLGNVYDSQGDFLQAIKYHAQHPAIAKELGDRAGEGRAYSNLGCAYQLQGGYAKAIAYHTKDLAIAKEVGDRVGEGIALTPEEPAFAHAGGPRFHQMVVLGAGQRTARPQRQCWRRRPAQRQNFQRLCPTKVGRGGTFSRRRRDRLQACHLWLGLEGTEEI